MYEYVWIYFQHLSMSWTANSFRLPWSSHSELSPSVSVTVWILVEDPSEFHLIGTVAEEWCCEFVTIFLDYHIGIIYRITANVLYVLYLYQKPEIGPGMNRHCAPLPWANHSAKGVASLLASTNGRHTLDSDKSRLLGESTNFLLCFLLGMKSYHSLCRFMRG